MSLQLRRPTHHVLTHAPRVDGLRAAAVERDDVLLGHAGLADGARVLALGAQPLFLFGDWGVVCCVESGRVGMHVCIQTGVRCGGGMLRMT
jgi:hypothetical protein